MPHATCPCSTCIPTSYQNQYPLAACYPSQGRRVSTVPWYAPKHFPHFPHFCFIKCIFRKIQCKAIYFCRRKQMSFSTHVVGLKKFFGLSTQIPNAGAHVHWIQQEKTVVPSGSMSQCHQCNVTGQVPHDERYSWILPTAPMLKPGRMITWVTISSQPS